MDYLSVRNTYKHLNRWMKEQGASTMMLVREGETRCVAMVTSPNLACKEWIWYLTEEEELKNKIRNKLGSYKKRDKKLIAKYPVVNKDLKTVNVKECIDLVEKLDDDKCPCCGCTMLFNYTPYCVYQFSFDRINNNMIHCKENLRIICWNCNSSGEDAIKQDCTRGCHIRKYELGRGLLYQIQQFKYPLTFRLNKPTHKEYNCSYCGINYVYAYDGLCEKCCTAEWTKCDICGTSCNEIKKYKNKDTLKLNQVFQCLAHCHKCELSNKCVICSYIHASPFNSNNCENPCY